MSHFHNLNINLACSIWTCALKSPPSSSIHLHLTLWDRPTSIVGAASKLNPKYVQIATSPIITDQHQPTLTITSELQSTFRHNLNREGRLPCPHHGKITPFPWEIQGQTTIMAPSVQCNSSRISKCLADCKSDLGPRTYPWTPYNNQSHDEVWQGASPC